MKTKKNRLMPLDMVKALMIEKGVDKAPVKNLAWNKVVSEYDGPYYVPNAESSNRYYGKSPCTIMGLESKSNSKISACKKGKSPIKEEKLKNLLMEKEILLSNCVTEKYKEIMYLYNSEDKEDFLPDVGSFSKIYGKTLSRFLGARESGKKIYLSEPEVRNYMISKGILDDNKSNKSELWNKFRSEYKNPRLIPRSSHVKDIYGKSLLNLLTENLEVEENLEIDDVIVSRFNSYVPINIAKEEMIRRGVNKSSNIKLSWRNSAKKYNKTHRLKIPVVNVRGVYGKTPNEILFGYFNSRFPDLVESIMLNLEDLCLLDKTQLLQIAFLKKLPKDIYEEIVECPKGEERKKLIESIPERLEAIKGEQETFEDSLEEAVDAKIATQSEEEKKFKEDLKTGIDLAERIGHINPEERIKEIFSEINALDRMDEGDYDGPEAIDFLVSSEIQKLWNVVIRTSSPEEMQKLIEEYMLKKNGSKFFNRVTSIFLKQYQDVIEFVIPKGYSFPHEPLMMQKLTALMISERKQFANWSETGSGKTISGVLTSRYIDSKITLIFAVNSTISNWTENAIRQTYPDSKIYTKNHISENTKLDTNFYNYIVVNYEEFQNPDKYVNKWKPFLTNNKVDLVILDEIQKVKVKTTRTESIRRRIIENMLQDIDLQHGRDLQNEGRVVPVLALSATPVINSLNEVLSLLSLLRGVEFNPVTRTTRKSALGCHFELTKCGIRLAEESPATERLITFPIKRKFEDLSEISGKNILNRIDTSACTMKIGECIRKGYLVKGTKTIIYTDLITNVIDIMISYLQLRGFKVGEFTGRNGILRDSVMQDFIEEDTDILLASKPISTGVDGLQKVCNRIIILIPAWTYAEYHQLVGRINRKGTAFNEVDIIIPTIEFVKDNGDSWSLDNERLTRIRFKKALADVTVNGNIPDEIITDEQALKLSKNSLSEFLKNKTTDEKTSETPVIATEIKPTGKPRVRGNRDRRDYWSELQDFNQLISASTTEHIFAEDGVIKSKEDWLKYHKLRDNSIGEIKDQPIYTIARDFIKSGKPKVLGDMGCGMNRLKTLLPDNYKVISVDWYAVDETVKVCNLQDTSSIISDCELDIAVYSLAFWGKDWRNVLKDAYRILDYDGKIIIAQPIRSESKSIEKVEKALAEHGFENIRIVKDAIGKCYYMTATKQ